MAGDWGVHSAETEECLMTVGVKRVAIPAAGKLSPERQAKEHTRAFRRGYRWRASRRGLPACDATMAGAKVPITGNVLWNDG